MVTHFTVNATSRKVCRFHTQATEFNTSESSLETWPFDLFHDRRSDVNDCIVQKVEVG